MRRSKLHERMQPRTLCVSALSLHHRPSHDSWQHGLHTEERYRRNGGQYDIIWRSHKRPGNRTLQPTIRVRNNDEIYDLTLRPPAVPLADMFRIHLNILGNVNTTRDTSLKPQLAWIHECGSPQGLAVDHLVVRYPWVSRSARIVDTPPFQHLLRQQSPLDRKRDSDGASR